MASSRSSGPDIAPSPRIAGRFGVARRDVTPPVGIFFRNWGAATTDVAAGVHRPFSATALTLRSTIDEPPLVLVALDAGWWQSAEDERYVRSGTLDALGIEPGRLMINLSHTHAGPPLVTANEDRPGGEHVRPYLAAMRDAIAAAAREALDNEVEGELRWSVGRCDLAVNRSRWDVEGARFVTGYEPTNSADDTLLVGRVTTAEGGVRATIVNYACHPTTLAWDNDLLSPDYVGAMRDTVEADTGGAPCLFLLGACGELAPALQYVGDPAVADSHGRHLGLAACAVLEGMLPHGHDLVFDRIVESGAPLAVWGLRSTAAPRPAVQARQGTLPQPIKADYPALEAIDADLDAADEAYVRERLLRKRRLRETLGDTAAYDMPVWIWHIGTTVLVGYPAEAFSSLQTDLRAAFPDHAVVVMNVVNGSIGYLPPSELYDEDMYEVWQTPLERGCLERLRDHAIVTIRTLADASQGSAERPRGEQGP